MTPLSSFTSPAPTFQGRLPQDLERHSPPAPKEDAGQDDLEANGDFVLLKQLLASMPTGKNDDGSPTAVDFLKSLVDLWENSQKPKTDDTVETGSLSPILLQGIEQPERMGVRDF